MSKPLKTLQVLYLVKMINDKILHVVENRGHFTSDQRAMKKNELRALVNVGNSILHAADAYNGFQWVSTVHPPRLATSSELEHPTFKNPSQWPYYCIRFNMPKERRS